MPRLPSATFPEEELEEYLATGEPLDKAGAYGIRATARCSSRHLRRLLQRYGASGRAARRDAAEAERCPLKEICFAQKKKRRAAVFRRNRRGGRAVYPVGRIQRRDGKSPSPVSRAAGAVIRPVQRLASGIGGVFGRGIGYFTEFDELKAENEELKKQLRENEQLVRDAQLAIEENNRFRAQAGQPERQRTTTTVNAEVISRNPGDTAGTLTLDKGTAHGVAKGDLVTTIDGMVGYVSEAGSKTCEVTTVTDVAMQCGALITRTRETAIAEGSYDLMSEDKLRLSYLTAGNQVVVGDTVETSGRGGAFPKGIMIGTVERAARGRPAFRIMPCCGRSSTSRTFRACPSSPISPIQRVIPCREN